MLEIAGGYDNHAQFATALCVAAEERDIDLPEEWWSCLVEDYTPWQKRFAEICREVIAPAIKKMMEDERSNGNANARSEALPVLWWQGSYSRRYGSNARLPRAFVDLYRCLQILLRHIRAALQSR